MRMPGDHLSRDYLLQVLRTAGIPVLATRNATWQQLTRQAPPQVLADALGISPATAMRHTDQAGETGPATPPPPPGHTTARPETPTQWVVRRTGLVVGELSQRTSWLPH